MDPVSDPPAGITFGRFRAVPHSRELIADGLPIKLGGRAFDVLLALLEAQGAVVSKDALMARVWPGRIVEENNLYTQILVLRKALGKDRELVRAVSGRGYQFTGEIRVLSASQETAGSGVATAEPASILPPTNIPEPVSELIGRDEELAEALNLVGAHRLVTLTGVGGIGKTRLALALARELRPHFADGVWLAEFSALTDPGLVPATVAAAVGLELDRGGDVSARRVAEALAGRRLLLLLDTCEHLIDAMAAMAEAMLQAGGVPRIIATSREPLRAEGEWIFQVPPLSIPTAEDCDPYQYGAVLLFLVRSRASGALVSEDRHVAPAIGAICRQLDGIPLAIELAAARAAVLGVQQVATGLRDRFTLLTRGRRTALPRHQTLRAALDWSHELLSKAERLLLRRLAVFSGGFTVEAVAAVVNDDIVDSSSVIEGVANLVAKSLVVLVRDMTSRWYLLETIRAYALEKLAEHGESEGAALRHATYFRDLFSRSASASDASVFADERTGRVREIDNVRVALNWCFSAGGDTAIGVDLAAGYAGWFRVDVATSMLETRRGARQSLVLLTKAFDAAATLGDLDGQARMLAGIITHHSFSAEHDRTRVAAERLLRVADRMSNAALSRNADELMGCALVMVGRLREAQGFLQRYLNADRSMPDQSRWSQILLVYRGVTRAFLSRALWSRGFIDQAKLEAETSIDELLATDHPFVFCRVLYYGLCRIMTTTGDFAAAEQSIARLIETATHINAPFWQTAGRFLSGKLMIEREEFAPGVTVLTDAFDVCRRTGWRISYPEFKGALATGLAGLGQLENALSAANDGLDDVVQGEQGHDLFFAELLRIKGEILLRREAVTAAEDMFREALNIAREQEALLWELRAALSLARLRLAQGRRDEARQMVALVYDRFTEGFDTTDLVRAKALLDEL